MVKTGEPRVIRNRDVIRLCNVLPIMQEITALEQRREWERDRQYSITKSLSGMPRSGGLPQGLDAAFAALARLEEKHRGQVIEYTRELRAAERIINSIPSISMRAFVTMLYLLDMSAADVRREMNMTEYGFTRARDAVEQADCMQNVKWRERYVMEGEG